MLRQKCLVVCSFFYAYDKGHVKRSFLGQKSWSDRKEKSTPASQGAEKMYVNKSQTLMRRQIVLFIAKV